MFSAHDTTKRSVIQIDDPPLLGVIHLSTFAHQKPCTMLKPLQPSIAPKIMHNAEAMVD